MEDRDKIMKRLEALLNLKTSRGASQAEMETAMAKATEIAFKYRINLDEIVADEKGNTRVGMDMVKRTFRTLSPVYHMELCSILNKFFGVQTVLASEGSDRVHIIGTPMDVDFGIYVYAFLRVTFRQMWEWQKFEDDLTEREARSFYRGLFEGLLKKLGEEKAKMEMDATAISCRAIVLVDEHKVALAKRMKEEFPNSGRVSGQSIKIHTGAYEAGKEVGAAIKINKAIGGGNARI